MKFSVRLICLLCALLLLSGCVFPIQQVSPDPTPPAAPLPSEEADAPEEPWQAPDISEPVAMPIPNLEPVPAADSASVAVTDPKLALFWYAMADARVYELREAFRPVLDSSGLPWREFDAENDPWRQADQVRDAVAGGWNILTVQLTDSSTAEDAADLMQLAGGCPVLFFDRVSCFDADSAALLPDVGEAALICVDPADLWQEEGRMAGLWLTSHYDRADSNGDGQISYTVLIGAGESPESADYVRGCIREADSALSESGYPPLLPADSSLPDGYRAAGGFAEASDAGNSMMSAELLRSSAGGDPVELVLTDSPETALGALTALQASWYNLGGDGTGTVPLFCIGSSAGVRAAISLGQMTGAADSDAGSCAEAIRVLAEALGSGLSLSRALAELAGDSTAFRLDPSGDAGLPILYLSPVSLLSAGIAS